MFELDLAIDLILLVLLIVALVILIRRDRLREQKTRQDIRDIQKHLDASFSLGGYLMEAQDEKGVIMSAMRAGYALLEAQGCAFVPFNEWSQTLPVLKYGELPFLEQPDWQTRLSEPATRHACRNCKTKQAGSACTLLKQPADAERVYCVSLRCGGREIGVVSYFFSEEPRVTSMQEAFLAEMVRLTDLTLDMLRGHAQELEALRHAQRPVVQKERLIALSEENKSLLEQLEYQAVLDERTRLAREIHDGLAQTLAFLKMEATRIQTFITRGETASIDETLRACYRTISDAYLDARQAIDNLRHVPDEGLSDWLERTASEFEDLTGVTIDVSQVKLSYDVPNNIKVQLIRIVQEALTNVRKHAQSCSVSISAIERNGEAVIEIKDNGRGFTPEDVHPGSHYGLRSMRERSEAIDADFQVISAPGMGTTVRLQFPICEKENL